jgi:hypothetical protein
MAYSVFRPRRKRPPPVLRTNEGIGRLAGGPSEGYSRLPEGRTVEVVRRTLLRYLSRVKPAWRPPSSH